MHRRSRRFLRSLAGRFGVPRILPGAGAALLTLLAWVPPAAAELGMPLVEAIADSGQILNGIVTALAEDPEGFVWIGTQNGLLRYDGYRFRRFALRAEDDRSLGGIFVRRLWVAPDGRLWVGTNSDGVAVFDPESEQFTRFLPDPAVPGSLASGRVDAFASDGEGGVWIGTDDGLDHWSPGRQALEHHRAVAGQAGALGDSHVRSLLLDRRGTLWVGTWDGLSLLARGSRRFERFTPSAGPDPLAGQQIWALFEDAAGRIWWGSRDQGAGWLEPTSGELHHLPPGTPGGVGHPWVSGFAQPRADELWVATYGGGIDVLEPATGRLTRRFRHTRTVDSTIASDTIGALMADRSGLLWIGTWGSGLNRVNTANRAFRMVRHVPGDAHSLSLDDVFSVLELGDGTVWVGTNGNGIDVLDLEKGVIGGIRPAPADPHGLPDGAVIALAESPDGTVWVGTRQAGLLSYDRRTRRFTSWATLEGSGHKQVQRLLVAANGHLWIGTNGGLLELDPASRRLRGFTTREQPQAPFTGSVNPMATTPDGTLWVGTDTGLYALPPGEELLVTIRSEPGRTDSLSHADVNGLAVDSSGDLWVATAQGIDRLVSWDGRLARFESLNTRLGRPRGPLAANLVLAGDGRMWDIGVAIDLPAGEVLSFDRGDGFDVGGGWIGAYTRTRGGKLLFGGPRGLLVVEPAALVPWSYQPPLVVSSLQVDGEPRPAASLETLELAPQARGFSLEFAALDLSGPRILRYAYHLEGYEPDWVEVTAERRLATFTNLDAGRYTLRVKATNRVGQWSPHELALPVLVAPAFHETLWFRGLLTFAAGLVVYGAYLVRVRQLAARARHLEALVQERTADLARANAELDKLARTDPLTRLPNRRAFLEAARGESDRVARSGRPPAIVLGDVDHFKRVNDHYGHEAGDAVLQAVAALLRDAVRAQDTVARWGGEEFILLLPETGLEPAGVVAEKCRLAVEGAVVRCGSQDLRITMTFGVSALAPGESIDDCTRRADEALYRGKELGRNRVVANEATP